MIFKYFVLLALTVTLAHSIFMPIKSSSSRCLSEYSLGENSPSMKLKISFPKIDNIEAGEHFTVTMRNTQTNQTKMETVQAGTKFIKQEQLTANVIYEICITLKTERALELVIEYEAESSFNYDHQKIKVPQRLLKQSDMEQAFISAQYLVRNIKEYTTEQKERKNLQRNQFTETQQLNTKMTILSIIEITVILVVGVYQYFALSNYLSSRQYI